MLRKMPIEPVPHETARIARAMLPTENRDRRLADARETLFTDVAFLTLFPAHGQPALPFGGWHSSRAAMRPEWLSEHLLYRFRLGASGAHPDSYGAERTTARRMITADCACQNTC